jgi:hypothetical protein
MTEIYQIQSNINEDSPRIEQPAKIKIPLKEHQKALIYQARQLEKMIPIKIGEDEQMITQLGVICDHVGSGKSFEVLGTIADCPSLIRQLNLQLFTQNYPLTICNGLNKIDTNIIVVPHGIFKQWEDYITESTTLTNYSINNFQSLKKLLDGYLFDELYNEDDPIEEPLINSILQNKRSFELNSKTKAKSSYQSRDTKYYRYLEPYYTGHPSYESVIKQYGKLNKTILDEYDIVLLSSHLYNEFAFYMIKDYYFCNRLFFDEAESIVIPNTLKINALFYWFVTSSSTSLCNPFGIKKKVSVTNKHNTVTVTKEIIESTIKSEGFIKETFKMFYGDHNRYHYYLKNDNKFIEMSFKLPKITEYLLISRDTIQFKILDGIVSNEVIMMLNAGDKQGAINYISSHQSSEDNIINVVTEHLTNKLKHYNTELESLSSSKLKQELQDKIDSIEKKIELMKQRIKNFECCAICLDDVNNPTVTNCCQNVFCFNCIAMCISSKNNCPTCRENLTLNKIMLMEKSKDKDKDTVNETGDDNTIENIIANSEKNDKYENLEKILAYKIKNFPKEKRKILIFSEFDGAFNKKMDELLKKHNLLYARLKSSSVAINKTLREYRGVGNRELEVLLINSQYFGAGLNLQNSSDIIIMHRQSDDRLHQIIGRAQRIGRTDSLNVWKLYNNNEAY